MLVPQINHEGNECIICHDTQFAFGAISVRGWLCDTCQNEMRRKAMEAQREYESRMIDEMIKARESIKERL